MLVRPDVAPGPWRRFPAIVKPAAEDGSFGIGSDSVVRDRAALEGLLSQKCAQWGPMLVQRFIRGREFNLAIVGGRVLPHAEIDFRTMPRSLPPIVSYAAKWDYGSPEERGTVPVCPARMPARLARHLARLAERVWAAVDGAGYGRIDVRVDSRGTTFVTDVNPNPDLGESAGLARQAAVVGWSYVDLIARIVDEALARARRGAAPGVATLPGLAHAPRPMEGMRYTQHLALALGQRESRRTRST
jgi:D-alanine-D-alanine ligase